MAQTCITVSLAFFESNSSLAVGETVILLHPPLPFSRCFSRDKQGVSSK